MIPRNTPRCQDFFHDLPSYPRLGPFPFPYSPKGTVNGRLETPLVFTFSCAEARFTTAGLNPHFSCINGLTTIFSLCLSTFFFFFFPNQTSPRFLSFSFQSLLFADPFLSFHLCERAPLFSFLPSTSPSRHPDLIELYYPPPLSPWPIPPSPTKVDYA